MANRPWLYVSDSKLGTIGIDKVTVEQLHACAETGIPIDLVARGRLDLRGIHCHTWSLPPTKLLSWLPSQDYYAFNKRFFSWLACRYLRDHAGVIAWSRTALSIFEAAAKRGTPRILNVGGPHCDHDDGIARRAHRWPRIDPGRLRAEYDLATCILLPSEFSKQSFIAHGCARNRLHVIHRGVDLERFHPAETRQTRPFIVASCGILGERKGSYQLLELWRKLALPDAELWLIGHFPHNEKNALEALAISSVRFLGFRNDLPDLLRRAHVHVLLSRNEGFAKVLLEAAASGVVNVCTPEGGMPADAAGSLLVADRSDLDATAAILERLHANPEEALQLGQAARAWVETRFGWEQFRQRVAAIVGEMNSGYAGSGFSNKNIS
ncbi:MAG: glycosyltransferase [Pseudomonadota bacterium]